MLNDLVSIALRVPGFRAFYRRLPLVSLDHRIRYDLTVRPHYTYGVFSAARLASRLDLPAVSVVEFGVAGGAGLVALEAIAAEIAESFGIRIDVVGFDSGKGLPAPRDYRDAPHAWQSGYYRMDQAALQSRLRPSTTLVLGDVQDTASEWAHTSAAPVGFVAFDLDYYSSTMNAFKIFDSRAHLPRVFCYFDDVFSDIICHNEHIGELRAIRDFNEQHATMKICPLHGLRNFREKPASWNDQIYVLHDFAHELYCTNISQETSLPLNGH
jgi:hypothetical protein